MGAFAYCSCEAELRSPSQMDDDELLECVQEQGIVCWSCNNVYYTHFDIVVQEWVHRTCGLKEKVESLELELSKSNRRLSRIEKILEEK